MEIQPPRPLNPSELCPCSLHWNGVGPEPPGQYGTYRLADLVTNTIQNGLALGPQNAIETQDELKHALIEGFHELYDSQDPSHFAHILRIASLIDHYFFRGWLTARRRRIGRIQSHLIVCVRDNNETCQEHCSASHVEVQNVDVGSLPVVEVDIDSAGRWTIAQIIELLIHGMTHGYLILFSCRGGFDYLYGCSFHSSEARGHHGIYLRMLLKHVFQTIQEWDDVLSNFGVDDILDCNDESTIERSRASTPLLSE
ncbi:hypothetical protein CORC01_08022 [Colletotrichum orchidophilum]|uniref:Uncharacterized protein n=1 Tax=Colletotrichum orchidophilum TaxID=1209926 RepID=A0A1G4B600_9PEZI|nr:uncharacterized protein CORC01_08022 [Colletotrichum orchidophilum]OHE96705.1 hypothetical protein CORC01_08022 [Colletotrichum orchidophilum]